MPDYKFPGSPCCPGVSGSTNRPFPGQAAPGVERLRTGGPLGLRVIDPCAACRSAPPCNCPTSAGPNGGTGPNGGRTGGEAHLTNKFPIPALIGSFYKAPPQAASCCGGAGSGGSSSGSGGGAAGGGGGGGGGGTNFLLNDVAVYI